MTSLSDKLAAALKSRDRRLIRRRLPEPPSAALTEIDFTSNDYLSLSTSPELRHAVLSAMAASPKILGSGGSRLLVPSPPHAELESRLCRFLGAEAALLFNSGFDANVGFFSSVPQPGDIVLYDAHIHASVHDGMRLSRLAPDALVPFTHNSICDLRLSLSKLAGLREDLKKGVTNAFIAVESLYSMDGTIAPLAEIVQCVEEMLPLGNGYVIVDEAHATGIYGPKGRGLVVELGLEKRVFARLHTFGKALASTGAVLLTTGLVKSYLLNYARSLIYTTTLTFANIIAINCSFDMLENGTTEALSQHLLTLSTHFVDLLRSQLSKYPLSLLRLPDHLSSEISEPTRGSTSRESAATRPWEFDSRALSHMPSKRIGASQKRDKDSVMCPSSLPTPIIPILTPEPRALSSFLIHYAASIPSIAAAVVPDTGLPSLSLPLSSSSPALSLSPTLSPSSASIPEPAPKLGVVLHTKPIYPPTVPQGASRVRVCLHAGHTREDVELLVRGIVAWADARMEEDRRAKRQWTKLAKDVGIETWMEAKL